MHEQTIAGSDGATISLQLSPEEFIVSYRASGLAQGHRKIFVALRLHRAIGSAIVPFSQSEEGSTVFLPFKADLIYIVDPAGSCRKRVWEHWKWSEQQAAPEVGLAQHGDELSVRIPCSTFGEIPSFDFAIYTKDLAENCGWGRFFGSNDLSVLAGIGEKYIPSYYEISLGEGSPFAIRQRRHKADAKISIYQLFVRLFGNLNETRKVNGSLPENGVGKFNDINDAALTSIRAMGFTHIWLTGVIAQATATDYSALGQPADDPDLLKGLAGSPYAIRDYLDLCLDYAEEPERRFDEFRALLDRIHRHELKALIDFVPNHVARCYRCGVKPELNFGANDDRTKFFDPQNNFFYLTPDDDGPPLQLPTFRDGRPLSATCQLPGMKCDGRFDGELDHGRVTGNNVASWKPTANDWYETVKLNYGFDFTDPEKQRREYPNARTPGKPLPDTWRKMDRIIGYWQEMGVDGFRCDMSHMEPPEFWNWLIDHARQRQRQRQRQPATMFIGEAYDNDPAKVPGSDPVNSRLNCERGNVMLDLLDAGFDAVYDDPTYRAIKRIYEGPAWANDIDAVERDPFIFENSLRYAENHDEVRLASPSQWGGVGMDVGRPVSAILFGRSRGACLVYNGQETGESAAGTEGFGSDDSRTTIFDYWSMPRFTGWVNGHHFDGTGLSPEQKSLRSFYQQLVRLTGEPAFRDGGFHPLNSCNRDHAACGRLENEAASGHWCYSFLRFDPITQQRFLVLVNLHPTAAFKNLRVLLPQEALNFFQLENDSLLSFTDRLALSDPAMMECGSIVASTEGLPLPEVPPLSAFFFECSVAEGTR